MYSDYRLHLQDKIRAGRRHYLERRLAVLLPMCSSVSMECDDIHEDFLLLLCCSHLSLWKREMIPFT
jgi:hypothetical protein